MSWSAWMRLQIPPLIYTSFRHLTKIDFSTPQILFILPQNIHDYSLAIALPHINFWCAKDVCELRYLRSKILGIPVTFTCPSDSTDITKWLRLVVHTVTYCDTSHAICDFNLAIPHKLSWMHNTRHAKCDFKYTLIEYMYNAAVWSTFLREWAQKMSL